MCGLPLGYGLGIYCMLSADAYAVHKLCSVWGRNAALRFHMASPGLSTCLSTLADCGASLSGVRTCRRPVA